jgi:hypothetical protein
MPPQKRSKKNVPTETDQEGHHHDEDNGIFTLWNLRTSQIKNKGQNSRLSRKQELKRQHTL